MNPWLRWVLAAQAYDSDSLGTVTLHVDFEATLDWTSE